MATPIFIYMKGMMQVSKKKTTEEIINDVKNVGGIVLNPEDYTDNKCKLKFECTKCGNIFERNIKDVILNKRVICRKCSFDIQGRKQAKTIEEYVSEIEKIGGIVKKGSEYINGRVEITHICPKCNKEFDRKPTVMLNNKYVMCRECSIKERAKTQSLDKDILMERLSKLNIKLVEGQEYINEKSKLKFHCIDCGEIFERSPDLVFNGKSLRCRKCSLKNMSGKNSNLYKHNITEEERAKCRLTREDRIFNKKVLDRDNHKCAICGHVENIHVHHIMSYSKFKEFRYDSNNGISLCEYHHRIYHNIIIGGFTKIEYCNFDSFIDFISEYNNDQLLTKLELMKQNLVNGSDNNE